MKNEEILFQFVRIHHCLDSKLKVQVQISFRPKISYAGALNQVPSIDMNTNTSSTNGQESSKVL